MADETKPGVSNSAIHTGAMPLPIGSLANSQTSGDLGDKPDPGPPYDAILVPRNYPKGSRPDDAKHQALKKEFAPMLGDKLLYVRGHANMMMLTSFKKGPERNHRYWPRGHNNDGQEFYDWYDRGDGVMYGHLTDEAKAYIAEEAKQNGG